MALYHELIALSRAISKFLPDQSAQDGASGQGILLRKKGEFTAGTSLYLPPGQRHCLENPGPEEVRLLGVFYPSGSPAVNYKE